jgi:hypothetical protein
MPAALSRRDTICPQAVLDYLVSSRADGVAHLPECVVALGVSGPGCRPAAVRGSTSTNLGEFRTCSEVLCVEFLLFRERRKGKKRRKGRTHSPVV